MDVQEYLKGVKVEALAALRQDPHKDALDDWSYEILREIAVKHTSVANLSEEERAQHQARIWAALINAFTLGYAAGRSSHQYQVGRPAVSVHRRRRSARRASATP